VAGRSCLFLADINDSAQIVGLRYNDEPDWTPMRFGITLPRVLGPAPPAGAAVAESPAALAISCPSPVVTSLDSKPVSVTLIPAVTGGMRPITTACSRASGLLVPIGHTSLTCTATDAERQSAASASVVAALPPN
jgi:hypothetical protein